MDGSAHYEIQVAERVDARWSKWFDGLQVVPDEFGRTILRGEIVDQAALFGVLGKIRDLGLTLVSLQRGTEIGLAARLSPGESLQDSPANS